VSKLIQYFVTMFKVLSLVQMESLKISVEQLNMLF